MIWSVTSACQHYHEIISEIIIHHGITRRPHWVWPWEFRRLQARSPHLSSSVAAAAAAAATATPWPRDKNKNIWTKDWIIWFLTLSFDVLTTRTFFLMTVQFMMISVSALRNMTCLGPRSGKRNRAASIRLVIKLWDENNAINTKQEPWKVILIPLVGFPCKCGIETLLPFKMSQTWPGMCPHWRLPTTFPTTHGHIYPVTLHPCWHTDLRFPTSQN